MILLQTVYLHYAQSGGRETTTRTTVKAANWLGKVRTGHESTVINALLSHSLSTSTWFKWPPQPEESATLSSLSLQTDPLHRGGWLIKFPLCAHLVCLLIALFLRLSFCFSI